MPQIFRPRQSDAHRIACLALYRALLRQCVDLSTRITSSNSVSPLRPLQKIIQYRFRRDSRLQSPYAIQHALSRGQSHLSLLHDATTGSAPAMKTLVSTIQTAYTHATSTASARAAQKEQAKPPAARHLPKINHQRSESTKAKHIPGRDSVPLTALPLPLDMLKQPERRVPYLGDVQGRIAILRWPGQRRYPVFVSRVMRQKLKRVERLHDKKMELEVLIKMGEYEDIWEQAVDQRLDEEQVGSAHQRIKRWVDDQDDGSWMTAPKQAFREQAAAIERMEKDRGRRGRWLWDIVKTEKRLSEWEMLPKRVVRAELEARKLDYLLIGRAKERGRFRLADKVFKGLQERKEVEKKEAAELMSMCWVIPVELAMEPPLQPSPSASLQLSMSNSYSYDMGNLSTSISIRSSNNLNDSGSSGSSSSSSSNESETKPMLPDFSRGWAVRRRQTADNVESLPASHPRRVDRLVTKSPLRSQLKRRQPSSKAAAVAAAFAAVANGTRTGTKLSRGTHQQKPGRGVRDFRRALDTVKLMDFGNNTGR